MKRLLLIALGLMLAGRVTAQTFMVLHNFTNNPDGALPYAGLVSSGNTLYGTTYRGGSSDVGTVFKVNTDGTGFTNLHSFTTMSGLLYTNSDGAYPWAGLVLSGNTLYGTAFQGGSSGIGTIFSVKIDGSNFTNLHSFTGTQTNSSGDYTNSDGAYPQAGLILSGNTLYGTASLGGSSGNGTVFSINTDGTGFISLHHFSGSDGGLPVAGLILSGNTLYGTAKSGGSFINGTVFSINTNGSSFTNLHNFTGSNDGANPNAVLILSGNILYGTTLSGGSYNRGVVFAISTNGTSFTKLHNFSASSVTLGNTNSDGAYPHAGLILSGNTLYGTAYQGGNSYGGMIFCVNTDGSDFTNLHSFNGSDGLFPLASLILSDNTLFGTTAYGGSSDKGTVFSLSLPPPQLTIIPAGADVVLSWPTNAAGFTLQSTTNLVPPEVWSAVSPAPVVVNGQNTVTNPVSATQSFYRLMHP